MGSNQVSLTRMILNISTPVEQGLSLNKGEILQGTVQSIKDGGLLTLLLKGRIIEAMTQVPVNSGEQLFLQVDGIRDGRIYLRILTPIELQQAQSVNLASNLLDMGITPGKENLLIAQALLNNNLPLTAENIAYVSRASVILGGLQEENIQAAAFSLSRGVKCDTQMLPAVKQLLNPDGNLARIVESLLNNISLLEKQAETTTMTANIPEKEAPSGQILDNPGATATRTGIAESWPKNIGIFDKSAASTPVTAGIPEKRIEVPPGQVRDNTVATAGSDADINRTTWSSSGPESTVKPNSTLISGRNIGFASDQDFGLELPGLQGFSTGTAVAEPAAGESKLDLIISGWQAAPISDASEFNSLDLIKQLPLLKQLLEEVIVRIPGGSEEIPQKLEQVLQSGRDIVRGIVLLEELVKKEAEIQSKTLISEFLSRLETLERELSGPRIYNYSNRGLTDHHSNSGYYFSVPVQIDNQTHLCELRLNKETGKQSLKDQENIKLVIALETGSMGRVLFHMNWHRQGSLDLQGVVEKPAVQRHLESSLNVLVKQLNNLGYTVNSRGIKVAENSDETAILKNTLLNNTDNDKMKPFAINIII